MLDFEKYDNQKPLPVKVSFSTFSIYGNGETLFSKEPMSTLVSRARVVLKDPSIHENINWSCLEKDLKDKGFLLQFHTDLDRFKAAMDEYREEKKTLMLEFKRDLAVKYGVAGHFNEDKLFNKAWDLGHSSGLYEVEMYYSDLSELMRPDSLMVSNENK